jgi:hypothetical protein
MFVTIDESNFPLVKVKFGKKISNYEELNPFFDTWNRFYEEKKNFSFELDTQECGCIPIKYSYEMAKRISKIKKLDTHYLVRTIVIAKSSWIRKLMFISFKIVKPVAPVYIVSNSEISQTLQQRLENNLLKSDLQYDFINTK